MKIPLTTLIFAISLKLIGMETNISEDQQEIVNSISDQFFTDANPLSSYLHVPKKIQNLKKKLNSEFMQKAKINGLVSYIYYPSVDLFGHSELEVEGDSWTLLGNKLYNRSKKQALDSKIKKIRKSDSQKIIFPFFRYVITVTP